MLTLDPDFQTQLIGLMRKFSLIFFLLCVLGTAKAQQLHFMSQYLQHNSMLNPGAAGIANKDMVGISFRNQWSTFPGNPRTYMVYGDKNFDKLKAGLGAYVYRDQTGPTSRTGVQLAMSKHVISRDGKNKVGLGIELRGLQYAIDKSKLITALGNDPALGGASSKFGFDAGAGIYFTNDKLSAGAAVSQIIGSKLQLANVPNSKLGGKLYRHYNFLANYKIQTGADIYLIPNAMVRVVENQPLEYEGGMKLDYQDKIWFGVVVRVKQLYSFQAGFKLMEKLSVGYAYDAYSGPVSIYEGGSAAHEIGLRFDFGSRY